MLLPQQYTPSVTFEPRVVVSAAAAPADERAPIDLDRVARAARELIDAIGEDPGRPGLVETPRRVADSFAELFSGYAADPIAILEPLPGERGEGLIMVRDIDVIGICEHHLLPFLGTAAVAYVPGPEGRIAGLSRLARVVEVLSRRLQVQERLVREIADALERALEPSGIYVLVEAEQLCMAVRGARKPGSVTVTTEVRGVLDDPATRAEMLALARG